MNKNQITVLARVLQRELLPEEVAKLQSFIEEISLGNSQTNLTAIPKEQIFERHILDSAYLVPLLTADSPRSLIDVGTGAGIPGIPISILLPKLSVTLVDSSLRKVDFLVRTGTKLGLKNVQCLHGRAEELSHDSDHRERYSFCTARGLRALPQLLELCTGLVEVGGTIFAMKSQDLADEAHSLANLLPELALRKNEDSLYVLEPSRYHAILTFEKLAPLSPHLPRTWKKISRS
ncbi:MAG: 16S rRNA (guanine(527)-N(7))-methyltransferase RsmG [Bdellovibrionales bacterium]|nr:16S rRNA (guanine(527)-N(7))-methyltransferase RsmG [Bdellovibrionales bacterium]